jgi:uncharacterized protein YoxC
MAISNADVAERQAKDLMLHQRTAENRNAARTCMDINHCGQSEGLGSDKLADASRDVSLLFRRLRQLEVRLVEVTRSRDAKCTVRFNDHQDRLSNLETRLDSVLLEASQILREGQAAMECTIGSLDQKLAASDGAHQQRWREMCAATEAQHSSSRKTMDVLRQSITECKNAGDELAAKVNNMADIVSNRAHEQQELLALRDQLNDLNRQATSMIHVEASLEQLTKSLDERASTLDLDLVSQRIDGVDEFSNRVLQRCKELSEGRSQDVVRLDAFEARLQVAEKQNLEASERIDAAAASAASAMTDALRVSEQIGTVSSAAAEATAAAETAATKAAAAVAAVSMPKAAEEKPHDDSVETSSHCASGAETLIHFPSNADSDSAQLEGHGHVALAPQVKHSDVSHGPASLPRPPSWSRPQTPKTTRAAVGNEDTQDDLVCQGSGVFDRQHIASARRTPRRAMDTWLEKEWSPFARQTPSSTAARRPASAHAQLGSLGGIAEDLSSCIAPSASGDVALPGPGKSVSRTPHASTANKKFAVARNGVLAPRSRKFSF